MQEETLLQEVGLSEKEAKVYLACLQLGEASILQLAKKSGLKRPHVYNVTESLSALNLLSKTQKENKTYFIAEDPKRLKDFINRREEKINQLLPSLKALFNVPRGTKPKIKIYEGKQAMEGVYKEFPDYPEILFFGVSAEKLSNAFPEVLKKILAEFRRRKTKIKELYNYSDKDIHFAKKNVSRYYKVKFIPKELHFYGDSAIYGNKIVIISLDNLFMVTIESDDVVNNFRTLFELAWNSAIKI